MRRVIRSAVMNRLRRFSLLVALTFWASLSHGARCGHYVIEPGDHAVEVRERCGEPDYATSRVVYPFRRVTAADVGTGGHGRGAVVQLLDFPTLIEEWVYDGDAGHFSQLLRFSGGRLIDVEYLQKRP